MQLASILLAGLALLPALAQIPQDPDPAPVDVPVFLPEDPSQLKAQVKSSKEVVKRKHGALVWIQVTNRSDHAAEPLAFRLTPKKKGSEPVEVLRMIAPGYGRAGRLVLPGKKLQYPVLVPGEAALFKKAKVEVLEASFVDGLELDEDLEPPEVTVGKPKTESRFREEWQKGFDHTLVDLENRTKLDLDLVFLAKLTGRFKGEGLVFASLDASEKREVVWDFIPFERMQPSLHPRGLQGIEVSKLELVDWSVRRDSGSDVADELFAAAWSRRAHLGEEQLGWTADCLVTLLGHNELEEVPCRLGFGPDGGWRVVSVGELSAGGRSELWKYLEDLLQPTALRELPGIGSELSLERWAPLSVLGHRSGSDLVRYLGIQNAAIAFRNFRIDATGGGEAWTTRDVDAGWLLDHMSFTNGAAVTEFDWTWVEVDGAWLPSSISVQGPPGGGALWPERLVLELSDWGQ